jgi:hypothetical protein
MPATPIETNGGSELVHKLQVEVRSNRPQDDPRILISTQTLRMRTPVCLELGV